MGMFRSLSSRQHTMCKVTLFSQLGTEVRALFASPVSNHLGEHLGLDVCCPWMHKLGGFWSMW
jgi:hypothetical protein